MEKVRAETPDLVQANIDAIAELFPNVVTEALDAEGNVTRAVDFDQLRQELSDHVVEGPRERYRLDWPGKRAAMLAANAPTRSTLRPMLEESEDFENTKNIFIEGDNLEALKILQESYLGKVKLIYIDPPYNTGNDFIYNDDFAESSTEYLERSGQVDESGTRLIANTESNGRFHSDWLSMMYARLRLARNLLRDDGFLFVSIDDGEVANLRLIGAQVFGEMNFVCTIMWKRKRETSNDSKNIATQGEYLVVFARSPSAVLNLEPLSPDYVATSYNDPTDDFPDGRWRGVPLTVSKGLKGGGYEYSVTSPTGVRISRTWAYPEAGFKKLVEGGRVYWGKDGGAVPSRVMYAHESQGQPATNFWDATGSNKEGKKTIIDLFGEAVFDTPKPVSLMRRILRLSTGPDDLVLDFFAGSGTTAHAVFEQNLEDGGSRRFILVQLPEPLSTPIDFDSVVVRDIAGLARERIRLAASKVRAASGIVGSSADLGFRALRLDSGSFREALHTPDQTDQGDLLVLAENIKPDRDDEDLLFQVLVDWGLELSLPISRREMDDCEVFDVDHGGLLAFFPTDLSEDLVRQMAQVRPIRVVLRDSSFASDAERLNVEQIFRELSPDTQVRVI